MSIGPDHELLGARVRELEAECTLLRSVLEHLPVGTWIADPDGRLIAKNAAADRIWQGDAPLLSAIPEYTVYTAWPPDSDQPLHPEEYPVARALLTHEPIAPIELRIRRLDGSEGAVLVSAAPVRSPTGELAGAVGINVDITDRKREEAERERLLRVADMARAEAEAANHAKAEFLASMSHELRTPLNAIAGYIDLLDLGIHGPITDAQRQTIQRIKANQKHLLTLINDVLAFAKVEAGEVQFAAEPVAVARLLSTLESLVSSLARARQITLTFQAVPGTLYVLGDEERIRQILLNVAANAVKFAPAASGRVECTASAQDGWVEIRISDNGPGIAPEDQERIFAAFVQVHRRLSQPQEGVGLGLAISRDLARAMNGELSVVSAPGAGSTFVLRLRQADAA